MNSFAPTIAEKHHELQAIRESITAQAHGPAQAMLWSASRNLHSFFWSHLRKKIHEGCGYPELPIEIPLGESLLLNYGCSIETMKCELARDMSETPLTPGSIPAISAEHQKIITQVVRTMDRNYSELHRLHGVYSFEPWLQEMYRDCLDLDNREQLREEIKDLQLEIDSLPNRLRTLGLAKNIVDEVMAALRSFRSIQGQSRKRERDRTSVSGARDYASVLRTIEKALERAERHTLGTSASSKGNSAIYDLYSSWKSSIFEMVELSRKLSDTWNGATLDVEIGNLQIMIDAMIDTLNRCAEENGIPQCSFSSIDDALHMLDREWVEDVWKAVQMHDLIGVNDPAAERLEARRYGPVVCILLPGVGSPRFSQELRDAHLQRLARDTEKRDYALERRFRYPINSIVIPLNCPPETFLEDLCEAFMEFKSAAFGGAYHGFLEDLRKTFPEIVSTYPGEPENLRNPLRHRVARYMAAFLEYATTGKRRDLPRLDSFLEWAQRRLPRPTFLVPPLYRGVVAEFRDASEERREAILRQHTHGRHAVDAAIIATYALGNMPEEVLAHSRFLPSRLRKNPYLEKTRQVLDEGGPRAIRTAASVLRRFFQLDPHLKQLLQTEEAQFDAEVAAIQVHASSSLGKELSLDEASRLTCQRRVRILTARREEINRRIDRYMLSLLNCVEGNFDAARSEMELYCAQLESQQNLRKQSSVAGDGRIQLGEFLGNRATRKLKAEQSGVAGGTVHGGVHLVGDSVRELLYEDDFIHFNLASLYLRLGDRKVALQHFKLFDQWAQHAGWHLFAEFARNVVKELLMELQKAQSANTEDHDA